MAWRWRTRTAIINRTTLNWRFSETSCGRRSISWNGFHWLPLITFWFFKLFSPNSIREWHMAQTAGTLVYCVLEIDYLEDINIFRDSQNECKPLAEIALLPAVLAHWKPRWGSLTVRKIQQTLDQFRLSRVQSWYWTSVFYVFCYVFSM